jgi:hypothetical protein
MKDAQAGFPEMRRRRLKLEWKVVEAGRSSRNLGR